jgi:hypothetical protein
VSPVCNFEQNHVIAQRTINVEATTIKAAPPRKIGARRGAMYDDRRYRLNAAECLSAASGCDSDHRSLLLSISAGWHALARHDEAMRNLLASWGIEAPAHETGKNMESSRQRGSNARDQDRKGSVGLRSRLWVIVAGHAAFDRRAPQAVGQRVWVDR